MRTVHCSLFFSRDFSAETFMPQFSCLARHNPCISSLATFAVAFGKASCTAKEADCRKSCVCGSEARSYVPVSILRTDQCSATFRLIRFSRVCQHTESGDQCSAMFRLISLILRQLATVCCLNSQPIYLLIFCNPTMSSNPVKMHNMPLQQVIQSLP